MLAPHCAQALRVTVLPESARLVNCNNVPLKVTLSCLKKQTLVQSAPVYFWQARQWQTSCNTGARLALKCTWPQLQLAVMVSDMGFPLVAVTGSIILMFAPGKAGFFAPWRRFFGDGFYTFFTDCPWSAR